MSTSANPGPPTPAPGAFTSPPLGPREPRDALDAIIDGADPAAALAAAGAPPVPPTLAAAEPPKALPDGITVNLTTGTITVTADAPPAAPPRSALAGILTPDPTADAPPWLEPTNTHGVIVPGLPPEGVPVGLWQGDRPPLPGDWGYYWMPSQRGDGTLVPELCQVLRKLYHEAGKPTGSYQFNRIKPLVGAIGAYPGQGRPCPVPFDGGCFTPVRQYPPEACKIAPLGVQPPVYDWMAEKKE